VAGVLYRADLPHHECRGVRHIAAKARTTKHPARALARIAPAASSNGQLTSPFGWVHADRRTSFGSDARSSALTLRKLASAAPSALGNSGGQNWGIPVIVDITRHEHGQRLPASDTRSYAVVPGQHAPSQSRKSHVTSRRRATLEIAGLLFRSAGSGAIALTSGDRAHRAIAMSRQASVRALCRATAIHARGSDLAPGQARRVTAAGQRQPPDPDLRTRPDLAQPSSTGAESPGIEPTAPFVSQTPASTRPLDVMPARRSCCPEQSHASALDRRRKEGRME
jgi:hypothetical protein